jgi:hypothetical protein
MPKQNAAIITSVISLQASGWLYGERCYLLKNPKPICAKTPFGRSTLGFGSSSARCVIASTVPIVNAPFRTPVRNATPSVHPVMLFSEKRLHTKSLLACLSGIAANTMIVTSPPTTTRVNPACCRVGIDLFAKTHTRVTSNVIRIYAT